MHECIRAPPRLLQTVDVLFRVPSIAEIMQGPRSHVESTTQRTLGQSSSACRPTRHTRRLSSSLVSPGCQCRSKLMLPHIVISQSAVLKASTVQCIVPVRTGWYYMGPRAERPIHAEHRHWQCLHLPSCTTSLGVITGERTRQYSIRRPPPSNMSSCSARADAGLQVFNLVQKLLQMSCVPDL